MLVLLVLIVFCLMLYVLVNINNTVVEISNKIDNKHVLKDFKELNKDLSIIK